MRSWFFLAIAGLVATAAGAEGPQPAVNDTIELRATHHEGVPLHRIAQGTDDFQRVRDGAFATVRELRDGGHWLNIEIDDGRAGWIVERYIARVVTEDPPPDALPEEREKDVWSSRESCEQAFTAGARLHGSSPDALRVGTWNVRWFPRGCPPSSNCPENATDLDWLACTIAWTGVDLLSLQEILDNADDRVAMGIVIKRLETLTGSTWQVDLHDCGSSGDQHVGFLWNTDRINLSDFADEEQLNGASSGGNACSGNLRPGRYARATSTKAGGGVDFHIASVHFDSGVVDRDYQNRRNASGEIQHLEINGTDLTGSDNDILVVGDFNTMGRTAEPPEISAEQEIVIFDTELEDGYRRLPLNLSCSEYFRREAGLLDHIVAAHGMEEIATSARMTGYCAVTECRDLVGSLPAAYEKLSDHCPIVVEVRDEDLDDE